MDCLEGIKLIDDNSIDSIVTDPPYELGFMGKKWDSTGIAYNVELWQEALRVLKPGGHLLAFGGTRTYHRMVCAIEDAGFEIRDQMQWIYGSGFPKSMDISKAIDKKLGAKREVIKTVKGMGKQNPEWNGTAKGRKENYYKPEYQLTASATPEAKQWDGWGTALKPANEPIVVARKPISEKTIAENVMKWGTGGLNIDGCRIGDLGERKRHGGGSSEIFPERGNDKVYTGGRFPANVIIDEEAGRMLDEQSGVSKSNTRQPTGGQILNPETGWNQNAMIDKTVRGYNDAGGASRFFYCAKASKKERGEGNTHPTVKPLKLISYLITLVTPPNGICLDIFEGSGTHAIACIENGFKYIGFELDKHYFDISTKRISNHHEQLKIVGD